MANQGVERRRFEREYRQASAARYIDQATNQSVGQIVKVESRPGELDRYTTADGRVYRYFGSTRSITYLKEEK